MAETIQSLRRRVAALEMAARAQDETIASLRDTIRSGAAIAAAERAAILVILDAKLACYVTTDADPVKQACAAALYDVRTTILARGHIAPTEDATPGLGEH